MYMYVCVFVCVRVCVFVPHVAGLPPGSRATQV